MSQGIVMEEEEGGCLAIPVLPVEGGLILDGAREDVWNGLPIKLAERGVHFFLSPMTTLTPCTRRRSRTTTPRPTSRDKPASRYLDKKE